MKSNKMKTDHPLITYLQDNNPKPHEQAILCYGSTYKIWREDEYLGEAIWCKDECVGDSFQTREDDGDGGFIAQVFIADKWELQLKLNNH